MSFWDRKIVNLIHGTTLDRAQRILVAGPDLTLSRQRLDFGPGFYTTTRLLRAVQWALLAQLRFSRPAALIFWSVPYDTLQSWSGIWFSEAGVTADHFWQFVTCNRSLPGPHHSLPLGNFDVVAGPVAQNYRQRVAMAEMDQISFHTAAAIQYLTAVSPAIALVRARRSLGRSP